MTRRVALILVAALAVGVAAVGTGRAAAATTMPLSIQQVDTAGYPAVHLTLTLPPQMAQDRQNLRFSVAENGQQVSNLASQRVQTRLTPVRVVLVLDTSGSMAGRPLEDSKRAAQRFVDSLGEGARVALVAFADRPRTITGFTSDRQRLARGIESMSASGETGLYDAMMTAARLTPSLAGGRASIVVLSDGGDTVSDSTFDNTVNTLKHAGATVYAVALKSGEYNAEALRLLAQDTGGRLVPVAQSASLSHLFEGIAREIGTAWDVRYVSGQPRTKDIELDVQATSNAGKASASVAYANPAYADAWAGPLVLPAMPADFGTLALAVGLSFVSIALLASGVLLISFRERASLDQLTYYNQLHADATDSSSSSSTGQMRARVVDAVGAVAGRRGILQLTTQKLDAAGLPLRPSEYITFHILGVILAGVVVQLLFGRIIVSVIAVIIATTVPILLVETAADRRRRRFDGQLPDVLWMIAGSLRAGWGIQQAIGLASQEAGEPAASELRRVDTETRLGLPLEQSLQSMADRLGGSDFQAAVTAIAIQREVGGNLAEVLDIVAKTIREREALRRQIKALTAEGNLSMWILLGLPFGIGAVLLFTSPMYMVPLLTTTTGWIIMAIGAVLLAVGSFWMYRVTRIEV